MRRGKPKDIDKLFRQGVPIDRALAKAAREAILLHKRAGLPVVVWRNGRTARVDPDELLKTPAGSR